MKMPLHAKLSLFAYVIFLENEAQIARNNYGAILFMYSKQVSLPKISLILQKMKIGQKFDIRPFCTKPCNYKKGYLVGSIASRCLGKEPALLPELTAGFVDLALLILTNKKSACLN